MRRFFISIIIMLSGIPAFCQTFHPDSLSRRYLTYCQWLSPEKVFLHLDRTSYCAGETIWFTGYLRNASPRARLAESRYIYVDLLSEAGEIMDRIKVKADSLKMFPGHLSLKDNLRDGKYTIRAYTLWQMDNDPEYMFHQSLKIVGPGRMKPAAPSAAGPVDISFYPEGGRYFAGQRSRVGFKAMDSKGRSVDIDGIVKDAEGNSIARARTAHDGMGSFSFMPQDGMKYFLETTDGASHPIPDVSTDGASLSIQRRDGKTVIHVTGAADGSRYALMLRDITEIFRLSEFTMESHSKAFIIDDSSLHTGINHFLLIGSDGNIVSERLVYRYGSDSHVLSVKTYRTSKEPRSPVSGRLMLKGPDGKTAVDGVCSMSIVRGSLKKHTQNDNIVSYMNLSSELNGTLNDPRHYFDTSIPEADRAADMDLLMLIQGWKYYKLQQIAKPDGNLPSIRHIKEYNQTITGKITRPFSSKAPKNFSMFVLMPKIKFQAAVNAEAGSTFIVDSLDFPENTGTIIKVSRKGFLDYYPAWNGDTFADAYTYRPTPGHANAAEEKEQIPLVYEGMTDTLTAAVLTAQAEDMFADSINGHSTSSSSLQAYSNWQLIDYIKLTTPSFEYNNEAMINKRNVSFSNGEATAYGEEGEMQVIDVGHSMGQNKGQLVTLLIDGVEQPWWFVENLTVADVDMLSVSSMPDMIYGNGGGLVSIKLKYGTKISRNSETEPSLIYFVPLGYQTPEKFYAPRYDRGDVNEEFDRRNTIYWRPCIRLKDGKGSFRFCDTDQQDYPYLVRIEGITEKGVPFSFCTLMEK